MRQIKIAHDALSNMPLLKEHFQCILLCFTLFHIGHGNCSHGNALVPLLSQPCAMVLFDINAVSIQDISGGSIDTGIWLMRGIFVTDNAKDINSKHLGVGSRCLFGIAHIKELDSLQSMTLFNRNRQLVLVDNSTSSQTIKSGLNIHMHHHPVAIVRANSNKHLSTLTVACKNGRKSKTINFMSQEKNGWKFPFDVTSLSLEKICNSGHHPLDGTTLKGSVMGTIPFIYVDYSTREVQGGVGMDMLKTIAEYYNFKYQISLSDDVFAFFPNGTIGGSLGEVASGQVDFSLEQAIQLSNIFGRFTALTYHLLTVYIELKPKRLALYKNIINVFHLYTWVMTGISLLSVCIVLYITHKMESNLTAEKKPMPLLRYLELIYGNLFHEFHGLKGINKNLVSTLFHFLWILTSMFLVMAFHGNLKSSLVRKNYEERTKTLNEMIDKDMIIHVSSTLNSFLENSISKSEFNERMLCQARKKDSVYTLGTDFFKQMYGLVLEKGGASGTNQQSVEVLRNTYILAGKDFPFVIIPEWWGMMPQGVAFHNSDPRPDYFDPIIYRLQDFGIIDFFFRKHMPPKGMKDEILESEEPLVIEHLHLPLVIWAASLLVSAIFFASEKLLDRMKKILENSLLSHYLKAI